MSEEEIINPLELLGENEYLQQENKKLKKRIENTINYLENDLKSFIYSIEYKTLMKLLRGDN